jgi:hypothetical protein
VKNSVVALIIGLTIHAFITCDARASGRESAGGNPKRIKAVPFPHRDRLRRAAERLKEEIEKKNLPPKFVHEFTEDLKALVGRPKEKFFYVPGLVSFGYGRHAGDYTNAVEPDGTITLFSIGAFTQLAPAAPIFMTDEAKDYGIDEMAELIAQEIPHHLSFHPQTALHNFTCTNRLRYHRRNESFVNRLGEQIAKPGAEVDKDIRYALEVIAAEECFEVVEALEKKKSAAITKIYDLLARDLGVDKDNLVQTLIGKLASYASTDLSTNHDVMELVGMRLWLEDFEKTDDLKKLDEAFKRHFKLVPSEIQN